SGLSSLLTTGNLRTEKGKCDLYKKDVYPYAGRMKFILVPPASLNEAFEFEPDFVQAVAEYRENLGNNLYLGAVFSYRGEDHKKLHQLFLLGQRLNIPLVATNDVHYHTPARRE